MVYIPSRWPACSMCGLERSRRRRGHKNISRGSCRRSAMTVVTVDTVAMTRQRRLPPRLRAGEWEEAGPAPCWPRCPRQCPGGAGCQPDAAPGRAAPCLSSPGPTLPRPSSFPPGSHVLSSLFSDEFWQRAQSVLLPGPRQARPRLLCQGQAAQGAALSPLWATCPRRRR